MGRGKRICGSEAKRRKRFKRRWLSLGQTRCHCGKKLNMNLEQHGTCSPTIDHIIPWSVGGKTNEHNVLVFCMKCNSTRGDKDFWEWVVETGLPKQNWLRAKYEAALEHFEGMQHV